MTEEERKAYAERKVIPITSKSGRLYHVKRGVAGNVFRIENGKEVERYCIHPVENVPEEDVMLGQMLWLKWCEEDFLRLANKTLLAA